MILLSKIIKEVAKESLPHENIESAAKKLRRKFEKLIYVCGGDIEKIKDGNKCISFPDEEKEFIKIILTQLAKEEGLSQKLWEGRDDSMTLDEVHNFIQYFIDYLDKKGYSEAVIKDVVNTLDIIFQLTVREKLDYCHKLLDYYAKNLTPYLYSCQVHYIEDLKKELISKTVKSVVEAASYCIDLVDLLKMGKDIMETDDVSDFYGEDDDLIKDEYVERDKQVVIFLKENPEIKKVVEEKIGAKISLIWENAADEK